MTHLRMRTSLQPTTRISTCHYVPFSSPLVSRSTLSSHADVQSNEQYLPSAPTLSVTPSAPTDPPPAPPPLNVPPSRARRQLAARLALHSQQKADAEADDATASGSHEPSLSPTADPAAPIHLADELENEDNDPIALDDIDNDEGEDVPFISREVTFGEPLHASPPTHPRDGHDIDAIILAGETKAAAAAGGDDATITITTPPPETTSPEGKAKNSHLTSPGGNMRHLDLDDFANSPAADADDRGFDDADRIKSP